MRTISNVRRVKKDVGSWAERLFENIVGSKTQHTQKVLLPHPDSNSIMINVEISLVPKCVNQEKLKAL